MKKIIIIGGGFAGVACALRLSRISKNLDITLFDKRDDFQFIPFLPELIGREWDPGPLSYKLNNLKKHNIRFYPLRIDTVDLKQKRIYSKDISYVYDYLVLACGGEVNFYGRDLLKKESLTLYEIKDALAIRQRLNDPALKTVVISGAGYTGVEAAVAVRAYTKRSTSPKRIVMVEKMPALLGGMPDWMRQYVQSNLSMLGIELVTSREITGVSNGNVNLNDNTVFENALLIWAAGIKGATINFIQDVVRTDWGRIRVNKNLQIDPFCYCIGDLAAFISGGNLLRMGIQFAISQARTCAQNIMNSINAKPLTVYKPRDIGFIIPMMNNRGCGRAFTLNIKGLIPVLAHYIMGLLRAPTWRNKFGIMKQLILKRKII